MNVSVIVTAYNHEKYIGRCLRSLTHQVAPDTKLEIIVVDDCSSDGTPIVVGAFGDAVKSIRNSVNIGLGASLNVALRECVAQYVVRVDADDFVNANFVNFLHLFIRENTEFSAVACDYLEVDNCESVLRRCSSELQPIGCGVIMRRDVLDALGGYNSEYRAHEDKELMKRFLAHHELGFLKIPLYRYRKHEFNMTNDKVLMKIYNEKLRALHGDETDVSD